MLASWVDNYVYHSEGWKETICSNEENCQLAFHMEETKCDVDYLVSKCLRTVLESGM